MRTEDDLRQALASPPDPERADRLARTITAATEVPARRRRPVLILAATVLVLTVIAGFLLDDRTREAVPALTTTPTSTGEARVAGNWRMVHRVDPPPGWTVVMRDLTAKVEETELRVPDGNGSCSVEVWGAGTAPTPIGSVAPSESEPVADVTINGRQTYWDGYRTLRWHYRDDAVAQVTCPTGDPLAHARTVAERVIFEPAVLPVPSRVRQPAEGYQLNLVAEETIDGAPASVMSLMPTDADQAWEIEILVRESKLARRERTSDSVERDTIAGFPAFLDPNSGSLDLDVGSYMIQLHFAYGQDSGQWAPGRRQQLVRLAESMELAPDLGDRATWFDAEEAVPS